MTSEPETPHSSPIGRTILQYQVVEKLGSGGMGEIYRAVDTRLNRSVALKVLPASMSGDPDRRRRFLQEAQAASALNHPNIITIYDIVPEGGTYYIVMEYVAGQTLLGLIPKDGLRVPLVLQYIVQVAEALGAAHSAGIIHRDLKPANIMVTHSGLVKLLDFGLAKLAGGPISQTGATGTVLEAPLTAEGSILGTLNYMSPEQAEGKMLDARSDIFSFGSVLYEMLTGRYAFSGDSTVSTLFAVVRSPIQPISQIAPDVPAPLEQIVNRCLEKDPSKRYQTMEEVRDALTALKKQSDSGVLYNRPLPAPVQPRGSSISPLTVGAVVVVFLAAGAGGGYWLIQRNASRPATVPSATTPNAPPAAEAVLTNDSVLDMVQAKVAPSLILSQIRSSKTNFNLSALEIIRLTKAGTPPEVIEAMRNPAAPPPDSTAASQSPPVATPENPPANTAATPVNPPGARPNTPATRTNAPTARVNTTTPPAIPPPPAAPPPAPEPASAKVQLAPPGPPKAASTVMLGDGLPFRIALIEDVPPEVSEGDALKFRVVEDLVVNGMVVIPKDAVVTGSVVDSAHHKRFGIGGLGLGGKTTFRLEKVDAADGHKLDVRATPVRRPDGTSKRPLDAGTKKVKGLAAAAGAEYEAYVDGAQTVSIRQ
jgi:serine/threonine-protein kinase